MKRRGGTVGEIELEVHTGTYPGLEVGGTSSQLLGRCTEAKDRAALRSAPHGPQAERGGEGRCETGQRGLEDLVEAGVERPGVNESVDDDPQSHRARVQWEVVVRPGVVVFMYYGEGC